MMRPSCERNASPGSNVIGAQRRARLWIVALLGGLLLSCGPQNAAAQTSEQERQRELVDRLLRELIQAELSKQDELTKPGNTQNLPPRPVNTAPVTANINRVRQLLDSFATEASRLTVAMSTNRNRNDNLRAHQHEALQFRARSAVVAQKASQTTNVQTIATEFESLDRDWRLLNTRLSQIHDVDNTTRQHIQRLNEIDQELCDLLKVRPQLNRSELLTKTTALVVDLRNLLEDIQIELDNAPNRTELLLAGGRLQQQARQVSTIVAENGDYDNIAEEYKRFRNLWGQFAANLRSHNNRYLERSVRRVRDVDNAIHDLLWLPRGIDRLQLLHLTQVLERDVDQFFNRSPLRLLINLPTPQAVLPTASEFYGVCEHFRDVVSRDEDQAELITSYHYIESSWRGFYNLFQHMQSDAAKHVLTEIEQSLAALRNALQIQETVDRGELVRLAAAMENLAETLEFDSRTWLNRRRDSRSRRPAAQELEGFAAAAKSFHENAVKGGSIQQLRTDSDALFERWERVKGVIAQCDTVDRAHLDHLASRINPVLVELRTRLVL
jgi:hypothetical protein